MSKKKKKTKTLRTEEYDIVAALQNDIIGAALIKSYEKNQTFDSQAEHYIVHILACDLLKQFGL